MLLPPTHLPRDVQHRTDSISVTQTHVFGLHVQFTYIAHCHLINVEIGLDVNADKTRYMVMSRDQNAGRSRNMKTENGSVEREWNSSDVWDTYLTNHNIVQK